MATTTNKKKTAAKSDKAASHKKQTPGKKSVRQRQSASAGKRTTNQKKNNSRRQPKRSGKGFIPAAAAVLAVFGIVLLVIHLNGRIAGNKITAVTLPDKEVAWGIDVSAHNGDIDWEGVAAQADFAFVRVGYRGYSEGEINEDDRYQDNLKGAAKNDIPAGVYFYSQAVDEEEAIEEAEFLLSKIKGYTVSLPVVIDFEYAFKDGSHHGRLWDAQLNKKERTALINAFCKTVRDAGYTPGIYASTYIYESQLNINEIDQDVFIWVADYNEKNSYDGVYDIWQYSDSGVCEGVSSAHVDTNYWYTNNRR